jgi:hypothetical protein
MPTKVGMSGHFILKICHAFVGGNIKVTIVLSPNIKIFYQVIRKTFEFLERSFDHILSPLPQPYHYSNTNLFRFYVGLFGLICSTLGVEDYKCFLNIQNKGAMQKNIGRLEMNDSLLQKT